MKQKCTMKEKNEKLRINTDDNLNYQQKVSLFLVCALTYYYYVIRTILLSCYIH